MFIFVSLFTLALSCELKSILDRDLKPKVHSFLLGQGGLDWLGDYHECKNQSNSTYATILWHEDLFIYSAYGFCLPKECDSTNSKQILSDYVKDFIPSYNHSINFITFGEVDQPSRPEKYFFIVCFGILILLTLLSTVFQRFFSNDGILSCFNLIQNFKNLFDISKASENLNVIDGIRTLCSIGIIMLHCYFYILIIPLLNRLEFSKGAESFHFEFIMCLNYCVDVFFYLAGFLMSYLAMKEIQEKGENFSWKIHFLRRIIRYLPAYMLLIGFERIMPKSNPSSIKAILSRFYFTSNSTTWWSALFFMNNFAYENTTIYLGWTWTICVDFHSFIISSLIVYFYSKNKTLGYFSAFLILSLSFLYILFQRS